MNMDKQIKSDMNAMKGKAIIISPRRTDLPSRESRLECSLSFPKGVSQRICTHSNDSNKRRNRGKQIRPWQHNLMSKSSDAKTHTESFFCEFISTSWISVTLSENPRNLFPKSVGGATDAAQQSGRRVRGWQWAYMRSECCARTHCMQQCL